ncbi:MAG: hypothetical protein R2862_10830 [Thermoanaerobaculia bacterium]
MERVWSDLEAADYQNGIAADRRSRMDALELEWRRLGPELAKIDHPGARSKLAPLPAAARAIAEAALAQAPVYYHASLDYGRNTAPEYGFYYLGAARAARPRALDRPAARAKAGRPGAGAARRLFRDRRRRERARPGLSAPALDRQPCGVHPHQRAAQGGAGARRRRRALRCLERPPMPGHALRT